jgi:hypothetical protein
VDVVASMCKLLDQIEKAGKNERLIIMCRLLDRNPATRMTVGQALQHSWLVEEAATAPLSHALLSRLQAYANMSKLQVPTLRYSMAITV